MKLFLAYLHWDLNHNGHKQIDVLKINMNFIQVIHFQIISSILKTWQYYYQVEFNFKFFENGTHRLGLLKRNKLYLETYLFPICSSKSLAIYFRTTL